MDLEQNLYATMIGSFGIILIGYLFGRCKIITQTQGKGISLYMVNIALPVLIFKALVTVDLKSINWMLWSGIFIAKLLIFIVVVLLTLILQKDDKIGKAGLFGIFVTQSNDFAFGIPIVESIFSSPSNQYLVNYIYFVSPINLAVLNPIGFAMMEYERARKNVANVSDTPNAQSRTNMHVFRTTILKTIKGVMTNPLVFTIVLGIAFNFIFQQTIPKLLCMFINNISSSFGGLALFYLGWSLGSKETSLKGLSYLLPIALMLTKGIFLPIVMRTTVSWMVKPHHNSTVNATNFNTQTTFGFIYGAIPTAPPVVVFASMFGLPEDVVASGLVFGTIFCVPIIFASIQMMNVLNMKDISKFCHLVNCVSKDVSIFNIVCCFWVLCVFVILRLYRRKIHRYTMVLVCYQLIIGLIGSFYSMYCGIASVIAIKFLHWLLLVVMYGYCAWTLVVALSMSSVLTAFHGRIMRWAVGFAITIPLLIATIVVGVDPDMTTKPLDTPYFMISCYHNKQLGVGGIYVAMNIIVVVGAIISLFKMVRTANVFSRNKIHPKETESLIKRSNRSNSSSSSSYVQEDEGPINSTDENASNYSLLHDIREAENTQLTINGYISNFNFPNHVILVLLMGFLSVLNLAVALWYMVSEGNATSGLSLELQMLGVVLTFGQGFFAFMTFGFLKELFLLPFFERFYACLGALKMKPKILLPKEDELDPDIAKTCKSFMRHQYEKCAKAIVKDLCFRLNRSQNRVFEGTSLVNWLIDAGLLDDRGEAVAYGNRLLLGRVIRHVTDEHLFYDLPYYYEFTNHGSYDDTVSTCNGDTVVN